MVLVVIWGILITGFVRSPEIKHMVVGEGLRFNKHIRRFFTKFSTGGPGERIQKWPKGIENPIFNLMDYFRDSSTHKTEENG